MFKNIIRLALVGITLAAITLVVINHTSYRSIIPADMLNFSFISVATPEPQNQQDEAELQHEAPALEASELTDSVEVVDQNHVLDTLPATEQ